MELIVATRNQGKLAEIRHQLEPFGLIVRGLDDFPELPEIEEDEATFAGNARKKAATIAHLTHRLTLADDSGLTVAALNGAPGVFSARYAGPGADDAANNRKLLAALDGVAGEERQAAFVCVMALCEPNGHCRFFEGRLEGRIATAGRGSNGFGYDPLFIVTPGERTLAEHTLSEKSRISHRGQALAQVVDVLLGR